MLESLFAACVVTVSRVRKSSLLHGILRLTRLVISQNSTINIVAPLIIVRLGRKNEGLQGNFRLSTMLRSLSKLNFEKAGELYRHYISSLVLVDLLGSTNWEIIIRIVAIQY